MSTGSTSAFCLPPTVFSHPRLAYQLETFFTSNSALSSQHIHPSLLCCLHSCLLPGMWMWWLDLQQPSFNHKKKKDMETLLWNHWATEIMPAFVYPKLHMTWEKINLLFDSLLFLSCMQSKLIPKWYLYIQRYFCSITYITKAWKYTEFPLIRDGLIKLWDLHMMEYYPTV